MIRLVPNPRFYGWTIVATGFLATTLSSPGQSFLLGLYLESFEKDVGITRVQLSTLYAAATLAAAATLPLLGRFLDRFRARLFLGVVVLFMGLVLLATARVNHPWALAASFFGLRLLGQGALGLAALTVAARWFEQYRGRALGIVSLGYAFGELLFPSLVMWLVHTHGWRGSLSIMGLVYAALFAPLFALLLRERRHNEPLDGLAEMLPEGVVPVAQQVIRRVSVRDALKTPVFWGLLGCTMLSPMLLTAILFHQMALFTTQGWAVALVPRALMAYAVSSVVLTYLTSLALEKVPSRFGITASLVALLAALGSTGLPLSAAVGPAVFGALLGAGAGMASAANGQVWPEYFGIENLGAIRGIITAFRNGSAAVGPPLLAFSAGAAAYGRGLLLFGLAALVAAAFSAALPPARSAA